MSHTGYGAPEELPMSTFRWPVFYEPGSISIAQSDNSRAFLPITLGSDLRVGRYSAVRWMSVIVHLLSVTEISRSEVMEKLDFRLHLIVSGLPIVGLPTL